MDGPLLVAGADVARLALELKSAEREIDRPGPHRVDRIRLSVDGQGEFDGDGLALGGATLPPLDLHLEEKLDSLVEQIQEDGALQEIDRREEGDLIPNLREILTQSREEEDRLFLLEATRLSENLESVRVRHLQSAQDQVEVFARERRERFVPSGGRAYPQIGGGQLLAKEGERRRVRVHDEQALFHG